ncbi:MAG: hypothetical protein EP329_04845 [Deltaproteobacteria bacterium]|nr:MAG: hypothetical protein EP329_04845 [Deltaproteobacteria bacterium]
MPDTNNEIIIGGQRFPLQGITVVTYEDVGGYSFPAKKNEALAKTGSDLYTDRYVKGKKISTYESLVESKAITQIIIHTDLARDSAKCFDVLVGRGLSTHFMVDWDGTIYQSLDPLYTAYHAGENNGNSIGIDFNNLMKNLVREPTAPPYNSDSERFAEMSKKEYRRPKSGRMTINGGKVQSWGYTDPQYQALIALLKVLTDQLEIPKQVPFDAKGEIVPDTLMDPTYPGVVAHWHVSADRWDPGPGFDWERVYFGLQGEYNSFPILLDGQTNINNLLEPAKVKEYAQQFYDANEKDGAGGWYPMGMNQTWHGGIHLPGKKGDKVLSMFDGVVVAARFGTEPVKLGHNNFIVLRHDIPIPSRSGGDPKIFTFYSLYMHLAPIDFHNIADDSPKWVQEVARLDAGKSKAEEEEREGKKNDGEEGDGEGEGAAAEEEDEGAIIVEGDWDKKMQYLEVSPGFGALLKQQRNKNRRIALLPYTETPIKVRAGDPIAEIGQWGPSPDEWRYMLEVEVFADPAKPWKEAVNLSIHGRWLVELDDDLGSDLFVEDPEILGLFGTSRRAGLSLNPARVLAPADIQEFFTVPGEYIEERRYLHKVVTRHISEWSDAVDWVGALTKAEGWGAKTDDFRKILRGSSLAKDAIQTILPWIWLSKDVAEHIGIDTKEWRGILDHFHPIQFLIWLTFHSSQRLQVVSRGVSKARLKKLKKEAEEKAKEARFQERSGFGASFFIEDSEEPNVGKALDRWLREWDQGEWERTFKDEE